MNKQFIKDTLNVDFARNYRPVIKDGRFTMVNNTIVTASQSGANYRADLSLSTDFQYAGREKQTYVNDGYTDYSGFNKKYISEDGVFDPMAALSEFSRVHAEKRIVKEDTFAVLGRQIQTDSHEAFILNMLITWLKARLYKDNQCTDEILKVKTQPYRDAHVVVALDQAAEEHEHEIELGFPVDPEELVGAMWVLRARDNYWARPFVSHYSAGAPSQAQFYLSHVMGRKVTTALNFDVELPGLDTRELLLDEVNGSNELPADFSEIPWTQPDIIWSWVMDYIKLNRLEQAFAAALETLGALSAQPMPSSMEATQWQKCKLTVVVAAFSPTRARIRSVLEGDPYKPFAAAEEFLIHEVSTMNHFLTACAITNYYMWYGLYTLLHNEARQRSDWRTVFTSVADELHVLYTPVMRAACISVITGREYSSCMSY